MTRSLKVIPFRKEHLAPRWREELLARLSSTAAYLRDRALPKPTFVTLEHEL